MTNSKVTHYDTYIEIKNGLFEQKIEASFIYGTGGGIFDQIRKVEPMVYEEISTEQIQQAIQALYPNQILSTNNTSSDVVILDLNEPVNIELVALNTRPDRFHNMSEQEILNYLDQISQEE